MNTQNTNFADSILNSAFNGLTLNNTANADAVANILDKFSLRWDVSKQPLMLPNGEPTGFFGIVREDTQKVFSTCKDSYVPYQNSELAELLIRISEKTGYKIHKGGEFNGGGKVYIQLDSGNSIPMIGEDKTSVKGFITGINSHDGTTSLKWGSTNITISCMNTFAAASKTLRNSARHTASIHSRVEESIAQILGVIQQEQAIFDKFITLSNRAVTKQDIAKVVKSITDVDITMSQSAAKNHHSQYSINRSQELLQSIGSEIKAKGETLWGLFSGVTHYTSHVLPVPKRENARLESKYTGSALDIDNKAFELLTSLN